MPSNVKITNPREVSERICRISKLLEEFKSNLSEDGDDISSVSLLIENTATSLGAKGYEAARMKSHAKGMEKESEQARKVVMQCEKKIADCNRHLANMRKCKEDLHATYSRFNSINIMINEAVASHKSLEARITALLEKMEASF